MLQRVVRTLQEVVSPVVVVAGPDQDEHFIITPG